MKDRLPFKMEEDAVYFVPLGGCGVFGANMSLYGHKGKWIMVDCGMGFADESMPGIDILLPDPTFAESLGEDLLAIVLTHAHEDHIGAIKSLWPRLKKPMYATKFTAERIRQSVSETVWKDNVSVHVVPDSGHLDLGPFGVDFIRMAHSIPEANALAISVPSIGTMIHTGDWKLDNDPVVGNITDEAQLKKLGDKGVLALIGDSTNAMVPGHSTSERVVQKNLVEIVGEFSSKIVVTCFSTNVSRLRSIYEAASKSGRKVCLIGRSLWNIDEAARKSGYLKDIPPFLTDDEADHLPPEKLVYICTGSQGEPRSALSRISNEDHPVVSLAEGDVVIFSSRTIPGNERAVDRIKNRFYVMGANVISDHDAVVHASGHPYREELKQLYAWVRPKTAIPVHGEAMQLEKHAVLAKECGAGDAVIPSNGQVLEISQECTRIIGDVKTGILAIEGTRIVAINHEAILTRKRIMWNGSAVVTAVVDGDGVLMADPKITALGLLDENNENDAEYIAGAIKEIRSKVKNMPKEMRRNDDVLTEEIRITARRYFQDHFDRKPQTRVHLVRI